MSEFAAKAHLDVIRHMRAGDWRAAEAACRRLTGQYPRFAAGWLDASRIAIALKSPEAALDLIDQAISVGPVSAAHMIQRAHCLLALNRRLDALDAAVAAEAHAADDPAIWGSIGTVYSYANDQHRALAAFDRASALAPQEPRFLFNRASVRRFLGDLEGAEADYDRVIALNPLDYEAYINRSELRVQTAARNHVPELEDLLARNIAEWGSEVKIRYALAKEYEDLGEYAKSFEQSLVGAKLRRDHLKYDVSRDVATVDWIISAFPAIPTVVAPGADMESPVFIVGLPRSGTTLVERILSSHSSLSSAGELDSFALSIVNAVRQRTGQAQVPRQELVALSATLDFAALGKDYLHRVRRIFDGGARFIDKMPLNYLYCGLIHRALPNAKIIHVTRHPMAVCYAMYKTLFTQGYPFSYDLDEIAQYYIAYYRLMRHWQTAMPGVLYELSYEELVTKQVAETRRLLAYCGLEWEDGCVPFHQNPAASTTASASQIRRPIYDSSVSLWRRYESELSRLKAQFIAAGICI
jgi:tetratricopeptide (TPR) repeat protein